MPVSSSTGAVFEPRSCQFRAQEDILSSPNRAHFVPEQCIFRALFVLLLSPVRAVSSRALAVKYVARQSLAIFFSSSVSASITVLLDKFDSWKLTHLGRVIQKNQGREEESF